MNSISCCDLCATNAGVSSLQHHTIVKLHLQCTDCTDLIMQQLPPCPPRSHVEARQHPHAGSQARPWLESSRSCHYLSSGITPRHKAHVSTNRSRSSAAAIKHISQTHDVSPWHDKLINCWYTHIVDLLTTATFRQEQEGTWRLHTPRALTVEYGGVINQATCSQAYHVSMSSRAGLRACQNLIIKNRNRNLRQMRQIGNRNFVQEHSLAGLQPGRSRSRRFAAPPSSPALLKPQNGTSVNRTTGGQPTPS